MFFEIKSSDLVGKRVLEVGGLRFFQTFRNHAPASLLLPVQELIELLSSLTAIHPPFDPPRSLSAQSVPRSNFVAKVPNCNMTDRNAEVLGICNQTMVSTLSTSTGKSSADVRVFAARQQEDENALGKFCLFVCPTLRAWLCPRSPAQSHPFLQPVILFLQRQVQPGEAKQRRRQQLFLTFQPWSWVGRTGTSTKQSRYLPTNDIFSTRPARAPGHCKGVTRRFADAFSQAAALRARREAQDVGPPGPPPPPPPRQSAGRRGA